MPVLDWIGKEAVVNHDKEVPYRLLRCDEELSVGDVTSGNLLVEGDNLLALKALLPYYAGQVKCIYIDPPYNTGKERWVYNDNVKAPEMQAWLGKVVGPEAEDLSRHDKWLCMMYPRLVLLQQFLSDDGVVFISIGKDEFGLLRALCDEIFGRQCFLEALIWLVEGNVENQEAITSTHEYVLTYEGRGGFSRVNPTLDVNVDDGSKLLRDYVENTCVKNGPGNPASIVALPAGFPCALPQLELPKHPFAEPLMQAVSEDERYIKREMREQFGAEYPARLDDMVVDGHELVRPCRVFSGWQSARKLNRFIESGLAPITEDDGSTLTFFLSHIGVPSYRREGRQAHFVPSVIRNVGTTWKSSIELERMGLDFDYPKPVGLVEYLLSLYVEPGDLVLDSFCGSGTTGHAALHLNTTGMGLRFILVELDPVVASDTAARRLRAVATGYTVQRGKRSDVVEGLGGGFRYYRLGAELFDAAGHISPNVTFEDLARHIYFIATGQPLTGEVDAHSPLIGTHGETVYYLLYNGVLRDRSPRGGNVLTSNVLAALPRHDGPRVVYGVGCRLGADRLNREEVAFRQIPYQIRID